MRTSSVSIAILALLFPATVAAEEASVKHVEAAGAQFPYVEAGEGEPVLFVHGGLSDHRSWSAVREAVADSHRFIAYTQRGFGTSEWPDEPGFASDVHEDDLLALLETWAEPMHLVGWSYGGQIVLRAAIERPDLVRSVLIYEPSFRGVLKGKPEHEQALAAYRGGWGPTVEAMKRGANEEAMALGIEHVFGLPKGGFETLPDETQQRYMENAHVVPKLFGMPPPRPMTCEDLAGIEAPVLILRGTETLPFFKAVAKEIAACVPDATLEKLPGAAHDGPVRARDAFLEITLSFISNADGT